MFNGVSSDLQFAANGIEPESTVALSFHLKATYLGDIIITAARRGPEPVMGMTGVPPPPIAGTDPPQPGDVVKDNYWGLDNSVPKEILLGQTIYLQAVEYPNYKKRLFFNPLTQPSEKNDPELSGVTFAVTKEQGDRLGIYYEHKDADGNTLRQDILRAIGRYWKPLNAESDRYVVKIKATAGERTGEIKLEVKKPDRLGNDDPIRQDVQNQPYNIEDLIIEQAGKEGILPQYLKAIISHESNFNPSYRYEPFKDMEVVQDSGSVFDESHRYWIKNSGDLGSPSIPEHPNLFNAKLELTQYPGFRSIWDMYYDNKVFYSRSIYSFLKRAWQGFLEEALSPYNDSLSVSFAAYNAARDSSDARLDGWLRYEYNGGMEGKNAQTRIAASYGIMQLTYYGGTQEFLDFPDYNYPDNDQAYTPEEINVNSKGFRYSVLHFKGKLRIALAATHFDDSTWSSTGIEAAYKAGLQKYNGSSSYAPKVISLIPGYLPKKNSLSSR